MNWTRPHRVVEAQGEDEARHLPENQLGIISKNGHESHEKKKKKKTNIYRYFLIKYIYSLKYVPKLPIQEIAENLNSRPHIMSI
jgi:hypothetical protein